MNRLYGPVSALGPPRTYSGQSARLHRTRMGRVGVRTGEAPSGRVIHNRRAIHQDPIDERARVQLCA